MQLNKSQKKTLSSMICRADGSLSVFGERTLQIIRGLGNGLTYHFMVDRGFKKSMGKDTHHYDVKWILERFNIKFSVLNDSPRGGIAGDHIKLDRKNTNLYNRIIKSLS